MTGFFWGVCRKLTVNLKVVKKKIQDVGFFYLTTPRSSVIGKNLTQRTDSGIGLKNRKRLRIRELGINRKLFELFTRDAEVPSSFPQVGAHSGFQPEHLDVLSAAKGAFGARNRSFFCNFSSKRTIYLYKVTQTYAAALPNIYSWCASPRSIRVKEEQQESMPAGTENDDASIDIALMQSVAGGNSRAMGELVERWQKPAINFFYRALASRETAEDLSQQLFIRIYKAAPRYQPTAKFSTYLFSIARRLLINEYRRQQRKPLQTMDPAEMTDGIEGRDAFDQFEIEEAFQVALETLPENQKSALLLFKQQELSYQEIATVLETTESSVKTWIFRGRQRLKTLLKDQLLK